MKRSKRRRSVSGTLDDPQFIDKREVIISFMELVESVAMEIVRKGKMESLPNLFFLTRSALDALERIDRCPIGMSKREIAEDIRSLRSSLH
jgi:DNA-directed RNA polymerase subunit F